jgi:hypothetical protein
MQRQRESADPEQSEKRHIHWALLQKIKKDIDLFCANLFHEEVSRSLKDAGGREEGEPSFARSQGCHEEALGHIRQLPLGS